MPAAAAVPGDVVVSTGEREATRFNGPCQGAPISQPSLARATPYAAVATMMKPPTGPGIAPRSNANETAASVSRAQTGPLRRPADMAFERRVAPTVTAIVFSPGFDMETRPGRARRAGRRARGGRVSAGGDRRDRLAVDRAAAAAAAQHSAFDTKLAPAACAVDHSAVHDLPDLPAAHQASEVRLDHAAPLQQTDLRRPVLDECDCHDAPPWLQRRRDLRASSLALCHPSYGRPLARGCLGMHAPDVLPVTFRAARRLLSSEVSAAAIGSAGRTIHPIDHRPWGGGSGEAGRMISTRRGFLHGLLAMAALTALPLPAARASAAAAGVATGAAPAVAT